MARNKVGGKHWKREKHAAEATTETILKDDFSGYGYIEKTLGNGRFNVRCDDMVVRMGIIRGSMRNRVWINMGMVVLYSKRGFQDDKIDIVHAYNAQDVSYLHRIGEINDKMYNMINYGTTDVDKHATDMAAIDFDDNSFDNI
jgi:translation initiation factor 1A